MSSLYVGTFVVSSLLYRILLDFVDNLQITVKSF